jgi:type IV pilus assembly protein PilB
MSEPPKNMKMPPIDQLKSRPLGRVLIKMGRLTREQVHQGLDVQREQRAKGVNTPIGQILVDMGLISDKDRNLALAAQMGYETYDLTGKSIPKDVLEKVSAQMATSYRVVPVEFDAKSNTLKVVLASPENFRAVDDLRTFLGHQHRRRRRRSRRRQPVARQALRRTA